MPALSLIQKFEKVDRVEHFDQDGGGSIIRTFYVEPYTSHPQAITALKGTIKQKQVGEYQRVLPHADPMFPWFYCTDAKVVPFDRKTITGCRPTGFTVQPSDGDFDTDVTNVRAAADKLDDFDFTSNPDTLLAEEIAVGGDSEPNATYISRGKCGAYITAVYNPLIMQQGLSGGDPGDGSGFDYVNPILEPVVKSTMLGRNLKLIMKMAGLGVTLMDGLTDSASIPEQLWEFTITRRMVPFLPQRTLNALVNRINHKAFTIGSRTFPAGTLRCEAPKIDVGRTADGVIYYDIHLRFTARTTIAEYYDIETDAMVTGYVDWNHQLGLPTGPGIIFTGKLSYYPVGFFCGNNPLIGDYRGMYLYDDWSGGWTFNDLFDRGFTLGE